MKIRSLILIGLLASLFFAVALLPASLVWRVAGPSLPLPMVVERVGGTLWDGFLVGRLNNHVAPGPVVIRWDLKALRFLLGEADLELGLEGGQYRLQGSSYWGLWGKGIQNFTGDISAAMLEQALTDFGVSVDGVLKIDSVTVKFAGKRVSEAEGQVSWSGGPVSVRNGPSPQNLDFPGIKGQLEEAEGNLLIKVTETRGNQPLGELSLMPEQNLAGIKVLKRVMALAGFGDGGDEDKVLVNLQQPLPF